jgi:hypothetical protein
MGIASYATNGQVFSLWTDHRNETQQLVDNKDPYFISLENITTTFYPRWNLISIPDTMDAAREGNLAQYISSDIFVKDPSNTHLLSGPYEFQDGAYVDRYDALGIVTNGPGYWIRWGSQESYTYHGTPRVKDSIAVATGWNIISSLSQSLPVTKISTSPSGIISTKFYTYNGSSYVGLQNGDNLLPGQGYWVDLPPIK